MGWRGIHLSRPAYLSVEHRALKLEFRDEEAGQFRISVEDLAYLIVDSTEVSLSATLLARLAENGVLVVGVNDKHLPVWTALPWTEFHRYGTVISLQLEASVPLKKQVWAHVVAAKINAQADCLALHGRNGAGALRAMVSQIRSGDPDNVEARAARHYWQSLYEGRGFRRHDDDLPNAMHNYGYAILRAAIARQLCAVGFIPQIGLHHQSQTNAYNLADDLIEPYRPLVDRIVVDTLADLDFSAAFTTAHRRQLVTIMESQVEIKGEIYGMLAAIESTVASLKMTLAEREARRLVFPTTRKE
jgi:CRISPR-associated protein Cas1